MESNNKGFPTQEHQLRRGVVEYKKGLPTPELVNKTWQTVWKVWGERIGHTFEAPTCDRTSEELAQLQKENRGVVLVPEDVTLKMLGQIFPEMRSWAVRPGDREELSYFGVGMGAFPTGQYITIGSVEDERTGGGCIDIEMDVRVPHTDELLNEHRIKELVQAQGRYGQRLKTYIVGSQFSKLLTGHHFGLSRLPGSSYDGHSLIVDMSDGGFLRVEKEGYLYRPYLDWGVRSEGIKRT